MKGRYEQAIERLILEGRDPIEVNWINMSLHESEDGGADRCTDMLVAAGYQPDIKTVGAIIPDLQLDYAFGRRVNGKYIRLPQETWRKTRVAGFIADAEQIKEALKTLGISGRPRLEHVLFRTYNVYIGRGYQGAYDCDRATFVD